MVSGGFIVPVFHILILHWKGELGNYNPLLPFYYVIAYFIVLGVGVLIAFVYEFPVKFINIKILYYNTNYKFI